MHRRVVEALDAGHLEQVAAALTDRVASSVVFVLGGDVADRCVERDGVAFVPDAVEFGVDIAGVGDVLRQGG